MWQVNHCFWINNQIEGGEVKVFKGGERSITLLYLKGQILFTGCGDGIARAYDAKSATIKRIFQGHEGAINCISVVDDKLFTGSSDGTMRVWDAKDISDDFIVDEEPPPAPTTVIDGDAGLEQELDKLEQNEEELQETPEDGIIDDDAPPPAEEGEENTEGGEDPPNPEPEEGTTEDAIKDAAPEEAEVLASG